MKRKREFIFDLIKFALPLIAIGVSIKSCRISENATTISQEAVNISKESNTIANEALEASSNQFVQINRPYIIVAPKKFEDGQFWQLSRKGNSIEVHLQYELKNVGNVAAKDISFPDKLQIGPKTKLDKGASVIFKTPDKITIGPGDNFIIVAMIVLGYDSDEKAQRNLEYMISEKSEGVTFLLSVDYTNELEESKRYRVFMENIIHNKEARVIKSEMFDVNEEEEVAK